MCVSKQSRTFFIVVGLLVELSTDIAKPKGSIEAYY